MSKKKKRNKKSSNEKVLHAVVFITAILNLIQAIIDLIEQFR